MEILHCRFNFDLRWGQKNCAYMKYNLFPIKKKKFPDYVTVSFWPVMILGLMFRINPWTNSTNTDRTIPAPNTKNSPEAFSSLSPLAFFSSSSLSLEHFRSPHHLQWRHKKLTDFVEVKYTCTCDLYKKLHFKDWWLKFILHAFVH